jgi:hypothetical protein
VLDTDHTDHGDRARQREQFARDGLRRFRRAIEPASGLADGVWAHLARRGIVRDDPTTWPSGAVHHLAGVGSSRALERGCAGALDAHFGIGRWTTPRSGGQVVVTFPEPRTWALPTKVWHTDSPYTEPLEPVFGALMFVFLERVARGGGGTLVIAGSHRIAARFAGSRPTVATEKMAVSRKAFFRSHPWLTALTSDDSEPESRMDRFSTEADLDGLPARVVELTGEAGDIVIAHPLTAHCAAPNCGDRPRMMRIARPRVTAVSL